MSYHYSKTTGGFYDADFPEDRIPSDAVAVTAEKHAELFSRNPLTHNIGSDASGNPILVDLPPASIAAQIDALESTQTLRRMRDKSPEGLAWMDDLENKINELRSKL